jgi:hypothetical protein
MCFVLKTGILCALSFNRSVPIIDTSDFTSAHQVPIGEIAADYLVAHPKIFIVVSKKLQAR